MKTTILSFLILFSFSYHLNAQSVAINEQGNNPDQSAILDIQSDSKGVLIPRMTSIQRTGIDPVAPGLLVYDINTQSFWFYDGVSTSWTELISGKISTLKDDDGDTKIQVEEILNENAIRFDVAGDEAMVLYPNGELGIKGRSTDDNGFLQLGNIDSTHFLRLNSGRVSEPNPFINWMSGNALTFVTAGKDFSDFTERMRIDGNGHVGIGLTSPTEMLHVNGKVRINEMEELHGADSVVVRTIDGTLGVRGVNTLTTESDPLFISSPAAGIGQADVNSWNSIASNVIANSDTWNAAIQGSDFADFSAVSGITASSINNWNSTYNTVNSNSSGWDAAYGIFDADDPPYPGSIGQSEIDAWNFASSSLKSMTNTPNSTRDLAQASSTTVVTTLSTAYVDLPEMSLTTSLAGEFLVFFDAQFSGGKSACILTIDGIDQPVTERVVDDGSVSLVFKTDVLPVGSIIKVRWRHLGGSGVVFSSSRNIIIDNH
jgi:hypothetical protein